MKYENRVHLLCYTLAQYIPSKKWDIDYGFTVGTAGLMETRLQEALRSMSNHHY